MNHLTDYTDYELCERAIAALSEIETRWRKTQPALRLPIIKAVLEFSKTVGESEPRK